MGNLYSAGRRTGSGPSAGGGCPTGAVPEAVLRVVAEAQPQETPRLGAALAAQLARSDGAVPHEYLEAARALPAPVVEAFLRAAVAHVVAHPTAGPAMRSVALSPSPRAEVPAPREIPAFHRIKEYPLDARCWPPARVRRRTECDRDACENGLSFAGSSAGSSTPSPRSVSCSSARTVAGFVSDLRLGGAERVLALKRLSLAGCEGATDEGLALILRVTKLTELNLERCVALTDAGMEAVAMQHALRELSLVSCKRVGDEGVVRLARLRNLRVLSVARCARVSDDGLMYGLRSWHKLQVLSVAFCFKVTSKSLTLVKGCPGLAYLDVRSTRANSSLWTSVCALSELRALLASHTDVVDEGADKLGYLEELRHLDVKGTRVGDGVLRAISGLRYLETLDIGYTHVTEVGVTKHVTKLAKSLRWLNLDDTDVGDYAAERLRVLSGLQFLNLSDTSVTSFGIAGICSLRELRSLNLCWTGITDSGLRSLKKLSKLEVLYLDGENIGDAGVRHLSALVELRELEMYGANVTDRGVAYLAELKQLRNLEFVLARVTDEGAKHIAKLSNMRTLNLSQNRIGTAGVRKLLVGLPLLETLNLAYNRDIDDGIVEAVCSHPRISTVCLQGTQAGLHAAKMQEAGIVVACDKEAHPRAL